MESAGLQSFQKTVWDYYQTKGRHDLPWRQPEQNGTFDPYKIIVSEVMLQQTQVSRVIPKFLSFIAAFPTVQTLSAAPLSEVLKAWSGLGYNRRAKFLWQAASVVVHEFCGQFPKTKEELTRLPGIGTNTAGAVLVYAYNQPEVFIETNIRTVFIHHFFKDRENVSDKEMYELVRLSLPNQEPERAARERIHFDPGAMRKPRQRLSHYRLWYWALMDYGTYLKQTVGNATRRSVHYAKQSRFEGSKRQIRGRILRLLGEVPQTKDMLKKSIADDRVDAVLEELVLEGFIEQQYGLLKLRDL